MIKVLFCLFCVWVAQATRPIEKSFLQETSGEKVQESREVLIKGMFDSLAFALQKRFGLDAAEATKMINDQAFLAHSGTASTLAGCRGWSLNDFNDVDLWWNGIEDKMKTYDGYKSLPAYPDLLEKNQQAIWQGDKAEPGITDKNKCEGQMKGDEPTTGADCENVDPKSSSSAKGQFYVPPVYPAATCVNKKPATAAADQKACLEQCTPKGVTECVGVMFYPKGEGTSNCWTCTGPTAEMRTGQQGGKFVPRTDIECTAKKLGSTVLDEPHPGNCLQACMNEKPEDCVGVLNGGKEDNKCWFCQSATMKAGAHGDFSYLPRPPGEKIASEVDIWDGLHPDYHGTSMKAFYGKPEDNKYLATIEEGGRKLYSLSCSAILTFKMILLIGRKKKQKESDYADIACLCRGLEAVKTKGEGTTEAKEWYQKAIEHAVSKVCSTKPVYEHVNAKYWKAHMDGYSGKGGPTAECWGKGSYTRAYLADPVWMLKKDKDASSAVTNAMQSINEAWESADPADPKQPIKGGHENAAPASLASDKEQPKSGSLKK